MLTVDSKPRAPILPVVAGATSIVAAVTSTFATDDGPVLCLFRRCTGGYCPGCGGSRAAANLVRGDVGAAWTQHPWVVLLALQAVALAAVFASPMRGRVGAVVRPLLLANAAFGVGLWLLRLGLGHIPVPFG